MADRQVVTFFHPASGLTFGFWLDKIAPGLLHITARHGTTPDEAISAFFADSRWEET